MDRLNYQHLRYVWMVAREGTVAQAAAQLHLSPSTLSAQIHSFEDVLGEKLFFRRGRRLVLTEAGRIALRYADDIFSLGQELQETLKGQGNGRPARLVVGVLDSLSKPMVQRILSSVFARSANLFVVCREDRSLNGFLSELALFDVDVVLSDAPTRPGLSVQLFNHMLGESCTSFFAAPAIAKRLREGFPRSLHGEPFLIPGKTSVSHQALEHWFATQNLRPRIVGAVDDGALIKLLGEAGHGVFAAPTVDEQDIRKRYRVELVGRSDALMQRLYAITGERRITNPGVLLITERARREIFG